MKPNNLKKTIKNLILEYTGTGDAASTGLTSDDGNNVTSQRSRWDNEEDEMDFYIDQNAGEGGDGGHYKRHSAKSELGFNTYSHVKFEELSNYIKQVLEEFEEEEIEEQAYGSATLTTQGQAKSRASIPTDEYPYKRNTKSKFPGVWGENLLKEQGGDPTIAGYQQEIDDANTTIRRATLGIAKRNYEIALDGAQKSAGAPNKALETADKKKMELFNQKEEVEQYLRVLKAELNDLKEIPVSPEKGTPTPEQIKRMDVIRDYILGYEKELTQIKDSFDKAVTSWEAAMDAKNAATSAASKASTAARKTYDAAVKASKTKKKTMQEFKINLLKDYIKNRKNKNLMEQMDSYKREILLEKATSKFFKLFDKGKTDEEILRLYAERGVVVPEPFIVKLRKKYESLKHEKLDLEEFEREAKNFKKVSLIDEDEIEVESKELSSRLFNEEKKEKEKTKGKINIDTDEVEVLDDVEDVDGITINIKEENKKYKMPPEIKQTLESTLKMYPLIRFVKNLKAVNSIPPSYRVFLLNNQYFDIIYETYSLMVKIGTKEYWIGETGDTNYAIKHINKLMTQPILKTGGEEEDDTEGIEDIPPPPGMKAPLPTAATEPEEPEPEPEPEEPEV